MACSRVQINLILNFSGNLQDLNPQEIEEVFLRHFFLIFPPNLVILSAVINVIIASSFQVVVVLFSSVVVVLEHSSLFCCTTACFEMFLGLLQAHVLTFDGISISVNDNICR